MISKITQEKYISLLFLFFYPPLKNAFDNEQKLSHTKVMSQGKEMLDTRDSEDVKDGDSRSRQGFMT